MTEEQVNNILILNRLESELELKWYRGENIPEDLMTRIERLRAKVKQAITESPNQ